MENAAALLREISSVDHRYQYISRILGNCHIDTDEVIEAYAGEIFHRQCDAGEMIVLALDQKDRRRPRGCDAVRFRTIVH